MLPSSARSIGTQAVTSLPSNRSTILADSRYRNADDDAYDFTVNLSGNAIYAKELYYQRLFWNQPLFAHNNSNAELLFQVNGDTSITYVVYATPFLMYTEFDGNPPGTSMLTPQLGSYASNMELGLNGDVRSLPNNTTLVNGTGIVKDSLGNDMQINFRYSPSKGFAIYPVQNLVLFPDGYTIQILDCSYVRFAHFVHGFGVLNARQTDDLFVPRNGFFAVYYSDTSPNLIPTRYIVIQSKELNKDRRLISFHNGNFSNFVNELAIFALNRENTGAFHSQIAGDDATVVSLRDDYTPQNFRIQILNELGEILRCDDPISNYINSDIADPLTIDSFISGARQNRGSPNFTNGIIFGIRRVFDSVPQVFSAHCNTNSADPHSMYNSIAFGTFVPANPFSIGSNDIEGAQGIYLDTATTPTFPFAGLKFRENGSQTIGSSRKYYSYFTYTPIVNLQPTVNIDLTGVCAPIFGSAGVSPWQMWLYMIDAKTLSRLGYAIIFSSPDVNLNVPPTGFDISVATSSLMIMNQAFLQTKHTVFFMVIPMIVRPPNFLTALDTNTMDSIVIRNPYFFNFRTTFNPSNVQSQYAPPPTSEGDYSFGDPLADGLCEENIHEIAAVLEYN
jgi:hypothetical protein